MRLPQALMWLLGSMLALLPVFGALHLPAITATFSLLETHASSTVLMVLLAGPCALIMLTHFAPALIADPAAKTDRPQWRQANALAWLLFGFTLAIWHAAVRLHERWPSARDGAIETFEATVRDLPKTYDRATRLSLDLQTPAGGRLVRVSWYGAPAVQPGERWQLKLKLARPFGLANPAGFDFERFAALENIAATGYVVDTKDNRKLGSSSGIDALRARLSQHIADALPETPARALLQALAVGDTRSVTDADWQRYRTMGITHLIAISGLHVTLLATIGALLCFGVLWLFPAFTRIVPRTQCCAAVGLLCAMGYAFLSGLNVPAVRTLVMLAAVLLAVLTRRVQTRWQALALAIALVLLMDPLTILSAGTWLSFTAVGLLMMVYGQRYPALNWWQGFFAAQILMTIGLLPLSLLFFQESSALAPLINLLAIPLFTGILVPVCLAIVVLLLTAPPLAVPLLRLAHTILRFALDQTAPMIDWHWRMSFAAPDLWALAFAALGVWLLFAPLRAPLRALGVLFLVPLFLPSVTPKLAEGEFTLRLFDVGQGLSVLVQTRERSLLFDTGPGIPDGANAGQTVLVPSLVRMGVKDLARVVVSHNDLDHSGGLVPLRQAFPNAVIESSAKAQIAGSKACLAGQVWTWNGVSFRYLHPNAGLPYLRNQSSCVLVIRGAFGSAMLPGDIDDVIEARLLRTQAEHLDIDVLVAPHHGSASSSTADFLSAVSPKHVIYPVGHRNRFEFPRAQVRARVQALSAQEWLSAKQGAMLWRSTALGWQHESARDVQQFWWRADVVRP